MDHGMPSSEAPRCSSVRPCSSVTYGVGLVGGLNAFPFRLPFLATVQRTELVARPYVAHDAPNAPRAGVPNGLVRLRLVRGLWGPFVCHCCGHSLTPLALAVLRQTPDKQRQLEPTTAETPQSCRRLAALARLTRADSPRAREDRPP